MTGVGALAKMGVNAGVKLTASAAKAVLNGGVKETIETGITKGLQAAGGMADNIAVNAQGMGDNLLGKLDNLNPKAGANDVVGMQAKFGDDVSRELVDVNHSMPDVAARYQSQVTGLPPGKEVLQNGVLFDGFKDGALIEAKGLGYAKLLKNGDTRFGLGNRILKQARHQVTAANGTPLKWIVAEEDFAKALKTMFKGYRFPIEVVVEQMIF